MTPSRGGTRPDGAASTREASAGIAGEEEFHRSLRPQSFAEYIGQRAACEQLAISVAASGARAEALDHVLIHGPPGLGKTTLAGVLAKELRVPIHSTAGPLIPRTGDMVALLNALTENEILFVDEIHRLAPAVAEVLYPAMEDRHVDIMVGEKLGAHAFRIDLPPFSLIGATTRADLLAGPLRARFPITHQLEFYSPEDVARVVTRSARVLGVPLDPEAGEEIALRSRGTPRVANNLLKQIRDYAQVRGDGRVTTAIVDAALELARIDGEGLDRFDRKVLESIAGHFGGGPVGIANLAATLGMDVRTLEEVHEPYLIYRGFVQRTAKGRMLTATGWRHLDREPPAGTDAPGGGLFVGEDGNGGGFASASDSG